MKLVNFHVKEYRSIMNSGPIPVDARTVFVGRNESGKSNLLRALERANPAQDILAFRKSRDFPMHLEDARFKEINTFLTTQWEFDDEDRARLEGVQSHAARITGCSIEYRYNGGSVWNFVGLPRPNIDQEGLKKSARLAKQAVLRIATEPDGDHKSVVNAIGAVEEAFKKPDATRGWAEAAKKALDSLQPALGAAKLEPTQACEEHLAVLEDAPDRVLDWRKEWQATVDAVKGFMPTFVYLDEYPNLQGHQRINEYLDRAKSKEYTDEDAEFQRLLKVAGLDAASLHHLLAEDHDERRRLLDRASAQVSTKMNQLWTDNELVVDFRMDGDNFDILVSDQMSGPHVKIPLDDRSRGFRWFFSFYMAMAADTAGGDKENAIILLDEPGLFLHPRSQHDLINTLDSQFENQILYSTHSPFMIPSKDLSRVRTVVRDRDTRVNADLSGDDRTLFPLQSALGYDLAQNLFISSKNVVVEGITDYWYLNAASAFFNAEDGSGLPDEIVLTPAGGANKITYLASLLTSQGLETLVVFDSDRQGLGAAKDLVNSKLVKKANVIMVADIVKRKDADIEDMLSDACYDVLVKESYASELSGKALTLNEKIPRKVRRYEKAFEDEGLVFQKARPAKLFLSKLATYGGTFLDAESRQQMAAMLAEIKKRMPD